MLLYQANMHANMPHQSKLQANLAQYKAHQQNIELEV